MSAPPVKPSPTPGAAEVRAAELGAVPGNEHPSGSHNLATIREAVVIADQAVENTQKATRLQWIGLGLLGAVTIAVGSFLGWVFIQGGIISTAQAQTAATAETALEKARENTAAIAAVDAGARAEVAQLRKELADERANTDQKLNTADRKLTDMQVTLQAVLREVRK